jgi:hypothetical protein
MIDITKIQFELPVKVFDEFGREEAKSAIFTLDLTRQTLTASIPVEDRHGKYYSQRYAYQLTPLPDDPPPLTERLK